VNARPGRDHSTDRGKMQERFWTSVLRSDDAQWPERRQGLASNGLPLWHPPGQEIMMKITKLVCLSLFTSALVLGRPVFAETSAKTEVDNIAKEWGKSVVDLSKNAKSQGALQTSLDKATEKAKASLQKIKCVSGDKETAALLAHSSDVIKEQVSSLSKYLGLTYVPSCVSGSMSVKFTINVK
jgi:hypothetical protein